MVEIMYTHANINNYNKFEINSNLIIKSNSNSGKNSNSSVFLDASKEVVSDNDTQTLNIPDLPFVNDQRGRYSNKPRLNQYKTRNVQLSNAKNRFYLQAICVSTAQNRINRMENVWRSIKNYAK